MSTPFKKLAKFTSEICNQCPVPDAEKEHHEKFRCCHRMFCDMTLNALPADTYYRHLYLEDQEVPFMRGDGSCIVRPEHRPFCTGYICHGNVGPNGILSKDDQKTYRKLCARAGLLPVTEKVGVAAQAMLEKLNSPPDDSFLPVPEK